MSIAIIRDLLKERIESTFFEGVSERIVQLLSKGAIAPPLRLLKQLLSGQLDSDRMDYLLRDSLHCGVSYGSFDYARLLETLTVHEASEGGLDLAIDRGGVHTLEALLLARYFMFSQVYYHRTRRIYDIYLERYITSWYGGQYRKLTAVLDFDDIVLLCDMRKRDQPEEQKKWAERILGRKNHSVVLETSDHADAKQARIVQQIFRELSDNFSRELDLIIDEKARGTIHNFYVDGDEEIGEEFMVISRNGDSLPLTRESKVIHSMPKRFHVLRIYAEGEGEQMKAAKEKAASLYKKLN